MRRGPIIATWSLLSC